VIIHQNSEHQNEVTKFERVERRKEVASALSRRTISEKIGWRRNRRTSQRKVVRTKQTIEDAAFIDSKTQHGKLWMKEHTNDLNNELTFRGLEEFLLLGWKEKIKALKNHEHEREPEGDNKCFFAQPGAPFVISKLV
jgi:hypothetical protein